MNASLFTITKRVLLAASCPTLCEPMDSIAHQAPLFMEFSRVDYWSGLPFPSPTITMETIYVSIDKWRDKEAVVHIYNGNITQSEKRNEVGSFLVMCIGPEVVIQEWSKSDRERQIPYDIAYMWSLKSLCMNFLAIHQKSKKMCSMYLTMECPLFLQNFTAPNNEEQTQKSESSLGIC